MVQPTGAVAMISDICAPGQKSCGVVAVGGSGSIVKLITTSSDDMHVPLVIVHLKV